MATFRVFTGVSPRVALCLRARLRQDGFAVGDGRAGGVGGDGLRGRFVYDPTGERLAVTLAGRRATPATFAAVAAAIDECRRFAPSRSAPAATAATAGGG